MTKQTEYVFLDAAERLDIETKEKLKSIAKAEHLLWYLEPVVSKQEDSSKHTLLSTIYIQLDLGGIVNISGEVDEQSAFQIREMEVDEIKNADMYETFTGWFSELRRQRPEGEKLPPNLDITRLEKIILGEGPLHGKSVAVAEYFLRDWQEYVTDTYQPPDHLSRELYKLDKNIKVVNLLHMASILLPQFEDSDSYDDFAERLKEGYESLVDMLVKFGGGPRGMRHNPHILIT